MHTRSPRLRHQALPGRPPQQLQSCAAHTAEPRRSAAARARVTPAAEAWVLRVPLSSREIELEVLELDM